jgi:hypothetical protein
LPPSLGREKLDALRKARMQNLTKQAALKSKCLEEMLEKGNII